MTAPRELAQAARYLRLLDPAAPFFTFQSFHDTKVKQKDRNLAHIWHLGAFNKAALDYYNRGAGVWVTVNETDGKGRKIANVKRVRAIWQEDDGGAQCKFPLPPSLLVESSPGKFHRYWLIEGEWPADDSGRVDFAGVMRRMVADYSSDKQARDIARVLRVPGFVNRKYDDAFMVRVVDAPGNRYTRAQVIAAFPPIAEPLPVAGPENWRPKGDEAERMRDALRAIPSDDRDVWLRIGMAIKNGLGDGGFSLWRDWSMSSVKFDENDTRKAWKSIKPDGGVTVAALFGMAVECGWREPKRTKEPSKKSVPESPGKAAAKPVERDPWRTKLLKAPNGQPKPLLANASLALREAPEWQGVLAFNQLRIGVELAAPPPWAKRNGHWPPRAWTDNDDVRAAEWLQRAGIEVGHTIASVAAAEVGEGNAYHPVRQYLEGLAWDGIERVAHFATDMLGAEDEPLIRAVSSAMLVAAVARAMVPGCKVDNIPILEGPQGSRKSTAVRTLFGAQWFTDDLAELGSKDAALQIATTWGAEISDLAGMTRAETERIKAFASRRVDRFRPAYGRALVERPRQSVMWGTTNSDDYLKDDTGARRFWPIKCGAIDTDRIERSRDQLWAEATFLWRQGEAWWLADSATVALAREAQESRQVTDAWDDRIADFVRNKSDVSVGEVLQFGLVLEPGKWGQSEQNRIARFLRRKGWSRRKVGPKGSQKWRYFRLETGPDGQLELGYNESGL